MVRQVETSSFCSLSEENLGGTSVRLVVDPLREPLGLCAASLPIRSVNLESEARATVENRDRTERTVCSRALDEFIVDAGLGYTSPAVILGSFTAAAEGKINVVFPVLNCLWD